MGEGALPPGAHPALRPQGTGGAALFTGCDWNPRPYEQDELPSIGLLRLSLAQLLEQDLLVNEFLERRGVPSAWLMSGGYGEKSLEVYAQFLEQVLPRRLP